jgi:hypothetical protein
LNGTHQLPAYAVDDNIVGENIDTIKKNTKTLLDARKEVGLEVNPEKTKYMLVSCSQKAGKKCIPQRQRTGLLRSGKVQIPQNNTNRSKSRARRD